MMGLERKLESDVAELHGDALVDGKLIGAGDRRVVRSLGFGSESASECVQ